MRSEPLLFNNIIYARILKDIKQKNLSMLPVGLVSLRKSQVKNGGKLKQGSKLLERKN